jgi:hypothetical protein
MLRTSPASPGVWARQLPLPFQGRRLRAPSLSRCDRLKSLPIGVDSRAGPAGLRVRVSTPCSASTDVESCDRHCC